MHSASTAGLPLVVAVTGHRDLHPADAARVGDQLYSLLDLFATTLPNRRIDCLSALADGADQLFAAQVLRLQDRCGARVRLRVPLPMPVDAYVVAQAGQAAQAQAAFRARLAPLLARADDIFEVPPAPGPDDAGAQGSLPYVRLAAYLVQAADLLVAVWDGRAAPALRQPGGTLDLVMRRAESGAGPTIRVAARRSNGEPAMPGAAPQPPELVTSPAAGTLRCDPLAPGSIAALVLGSSGR